MTRTTIATAVTASALAAALLSGCGGGGQPAAGSSSMPNVAPAPSSATTSSAPATSSPTASKASRSVEMAGAPGVPKPARMHTKAGAEAFVDYYFHQLNKSWSTPESGLLPPLSQPSCNTCENYDDTAQGGEQRGEHLDGPSTRIRMVRVTSWDAGHRVQVETKRHQNAVRAVDQAGNTVKAIEPAALRDHIELVWTPDGWRTAEIQAIQ